MLALTAGIAGGRGWWWPRVLRCSAARGSAALVGWRWRSPSSRLFLQPVADALMPPLEDEARARPSAAPACCYDAIVVLGGGIGAGRAAACCPIPTSTTVPTASGMPPAFTIAALAPRIIVSGGSLLAEMASAADETEAEAMRLFLLDLGVPEAIVDRGRGAEHHREHPQRAGAGRRRARGAGDLGLPHAARAAAGAARRPRMSRPSPPTGGLPEARASWENWMPRLGALSVSASRLREIIWRYAFDIAAQRDALTP